MYIFNSEELLVLIIVQDLWVLPQVEYYLRLFSLLSKQFFKSNYWQIKEVKLTAAGIQRDHTECLNQKNTVWNKTSSKTGKLKNVKHLLDNPFTIWSTVIILKEKKKPETKPQTQNASVAGHWWNTEYRISVIRWYKIMEIKK